MSTVSNCMRTSADSSWGVDQIHKEIYINLKNDFDNLHIAYTINETESQDSCNEFEYLTL